MSFDFESKCFIHSSKSVQLPRGPTTHDPDTLINLELHVFTEYLQGWPVRDSSFGARAILALYMNLFNQPTNQPTAH